MKTFHCWGHAFKLFKALVEVCKASAEPLLWMFFLLPQFPFLSPLLQLCVPVPVPTPPQGPLWELPNAILTHIPVKAVCHLKHSLVPATSSSLANSFKSLVAGIFQPHYNLMGPLLHMCSVTDWLGQHSGISWRFLYGKDSRVRTWLPLKTWGKTKWVQSPPCHPRPRLWDLEQSNQTFSFLTNGSQCLPHTGCDDQRHWTQSILCIF